MASEFGFGRHSMQAMMVFLQREVRLKAWTNAAVWRAMHTEWIVTLRKQHRVTESVCRT